jgi:hypothetical protein
VGHGGVPGKFDLVSTPKGVGFVKGKRSSGSFAIAELDGTPINNRVRAATCVRLAARSTTLTRSGSSRGTLLHGH